MAIIKHQGIILKITSELISVKIISQSACAQCDARKSCGMMECQDKVIDIKNDKIDDYKLGQKVSVSMSAQSGFLAVFWGYVLPLILVLLTLFVGIFIGCGELISGLSAIIILIPYYFGLFLCQKHLNAQFKFKISQD